MARARDPKRRARAGPFEAALEAVAALIERLEQPAAVIGGIAVVAHGFARATADIDLAVVAGPDEIAALLKTAKEVGLCARVTDAEEFARQNLVLLLEHSATRVPVDVSLALQSFEREAAEHAVVRRLGNVPLRVAPLTALLIYKMVASRPKDVDDVRALLQTQAPYDSAAVERTLTEFDAVLETQRAAEFRELEGL